MMANVYDSNDKVKFGPNLSKSWSSHWFKPYMVHELVL